MPGDADPPLDAGARRRQQAHQRAQGHALARARLAQDTEHLTRLQGKADAVDRGHCGIAHHEAHMQILDRDDRLLRHLRLRHALTTVAARLWPEPGIRMWQATARNSSPGGASNTGDAVSHTASAKGQRVRKRHPEGGADRIRGFAGQRRLEGAPTRIHRRQVSRPRWPPSAFP